MSRPNVYGLPRFLRKDAGGYFLDYYVREGGLRKRKRERLGLIPLAQAKKILAHHAKTLAEQKYIVSDKPKAAFPEAADSFLAYSKARKRSFQEDERIVARLKVFFGSRTLEALTPDLVEAYLVERQKEGFRGDHSRRLAAATLNREITCLKTIVRRAVLNGMIDRNPIDGVRRFKEQSRDRILAPEEFQALLGQCAPHLRPILKLAYLTGMRCGEVLGLRWDQLDLKNKVITLEAADTKTQEKREIPLTETLLKMIQRIPHTLGTSFVFTFKGEPLRSVKTAFNKACRRAGIMNFRFHDLRHCAVTNLRKAGVSDSVIMSISGHKTHEVFRKYDHVDRKDRESALQRAEILIDMDKTPVVNQLAR